MGSISPDKKNSLVRYRIVAFLFVNVVINYMDRANISLAGNALSADFNLSSMQLGYIFSAFGWAYAALQIPAGWISDRFGARILYAFSLVGWSIVTLVQGFASGFAMLFGLRMATGVLEAPAYPINNRVVTNWFPDNERAFAIAIYTSGQYVGLALLTPIMVVIQYYYGWQGLFIITGLVGIAWGIIWYVIYRDPLQHKGVSRAELDHLAAGGAAVGGQQAKESTDKPRFTWKNIRTVFSYKKLWGIYIGQFAVTCSLWFFLTWFPTYLVKYRGFDFIKSGFVASVPFLSAFAGILLSGYISDLLVRKKVSVGLARKAPVITGLFLSISIVGANYVSDPALITLFMSIAFFGNGMVSISWVFISLVAPKNLIGVTGGVFNLFGNLPSILVPFIIGYLVRDGNFNPALIFIGIMGLIGVCSYIFLVGKVERISLLKSVD